MTTHAPNFSLVTVTPSEPRFAFQMEVPSNWTQLAVPPEPVDFANIGLFQPVALFVAKYGAVLLTFSARPGLGEGTIADWFAQVCQADGIKIGPLEAVQAGHIPAVGACGTQESDAGAMALRVVMFEQGGWLHALMGMAPADIWDSVAATFDHMIASFAMVNPTAACVPLWPAGSQPDEAARAGGDDLSQARQAAERFLQAMQRNDEAAAKSMLAAHDQESMNFNSNPGATLTYELGQPQAEGEQVIIPSTLRSAPPDGSPPQEQPMPLVLCRADGAWKIDMSASINRLLGVNLEETMTQMAQGLGDAMAKGMEAVAEGLSALSTPPSGDEDSDDVVE